MNRGGLVLRSPLDRPVRRGDDVVRLQTYLQAWRAMLPGGVEIDVFKDVEP